MPTLALVPISRLDPSSAQHAAYTDDGGLFHYIHVDASTSNVTSLASFQLYFLASPSHGHDNVSAVPSLLNRPVSTPWRTFSFVPGAPGEVMLVQEGSARVLYVALPRNHQPACEVCLFGTHRGAVGRSGVLPGDRVAKLLRA